MQIHVSKAYTKLATRRVSTWQRAATIRMLWLVGFTVQIIR
jgi:hypothetical protein